MVRGRLKEFFNHIHAYGEVLKIINLKTLYDLKLDEKKILHDVHGIGSMY